MVNDFVVAMNTATFAQEAASHARDTGGICQESCCSVGIPQGEVIGYIDGCATDSGGHRGSFLIIPQAFFQILEEVINVTVSSSSGGNRTCLVKLTFKLPLPPLPFFFSLHHNHYTHPHIRTSARAHAPLPQKKTVATSLIS